MDVSRTVIGFVWIAAICGTACAQDRSNDFPTSPQPTARVANSTDNIWTAPTTRAVVDADIEVVDPSRSQAPALNIESSASPVECQEQLLLPYLDRAEAFRGQSTMANESVPEDFQAWWRQHLAQPLGLKQSSLTISLDDVITQSLIHSPLVQVAAAEPRIQETAITEQAAAFDWASFWETKYDNTNDPIGNTLTTGNNESRFRQQEWYSKTGLRKKNAAGGELEMSQRLGYLDNNSRFLVPPDQGSARLELNYRQPLLKGKGSLVNESLVLLANIDFQSANQEYRDTLQTHLADVTEAYWELVRSRSELLQRLKLFRRADDILQRLRGRAEVDALDRQIFRAEAAVANRRAEIARAVTSIKNAESRLRLLVNEPNLLQQANAELMPTDLPSHAPLSIDLADAIATAMVHRPDITRAIQELRAANVRLGVSRNLVLPQLDVLLGGYVAGLDADSGILNSWANQFKDGGPGFNVGLEFELPIGNRAAIARQQRRQWEANQALQQFRLIVETALNEVEISVREVNTTRQEMAGRYQSMAAAEKEHDYLIDRWQTLPGMDDSVTLLLEDLLDSQERLADEESAFAEAQFAYAVATVRLKQAMGTLFQVSNQ